MDRRRIQWMGHVKRMGDNRMPRIALEKEERGRIPRGRPRGRWEDQVWRKRRPGMTDKSRGGGVRRPVITETSDDDDDDDEKQNNILTFH
ncbi:hypothetical protein J6590_054156 [Homalodisca vitripennis]|nr:hypothetical protein J6590_054156 [Homalodisca vitripennis]